MKKTFTVESCTRHSFQWISMSLYVSFSSFSPLPFSLSSLSLSLSPPSLLLTLYLYLYLSLYICILSGGFLITIFVASISFETARVLLEAQRVLYLRTGENTICYARSFYQSQSLLVFHKYPHLFSLSNINNNHPFFQVCCLYGETVYHSLLVDYIYHNTFKIMFLKIRNLKLRKVDDCC